MYDNPFVRLKIKYNLLTLYKVIANLLVPSVIVFKAVSSSFVKATSSSADTVAIVNRTTKNTETGETEIRQMFGVNQNQLTATNRKRRLDRCLCQSESQSINYFRSEAE